MTTWESRCYESGIPDEVPQKLCDSGRVPSYRRIALAILRNDHQLYTLGYSEAQSGLVDYLIAKRKQEVDPQMQLL